MWSSIWYLHTFPFVFGSYFVCLLYFDLVPAHVPVELPVVVLHLAAQVVDHVVDVAGVAVLLLKELCHMVDLVTVDGFAA